MYLFKASLFRIEDGKFLLGSISLIGIMSRTSCATLLDLLHLLVLKIFIVQCQKVEMCMAPLVHDVGSLRSLGSWIYSVKFNAYKLGALFFVLISDTVCIGWQPAKPSLPPLCRLIMNGGRWLAGLSSASPATCSFIGGEIDHKVQTIKI